MAEKKKILYIVEAMGGGVFTYIVDLANELVNKYDMYIAYAVRKQTPKNYKDYFDKRIHLIEVKNFGRAIDPVKDIAALFEVKKIAAKIKPDVIHLHSSKAGAIGRVAFNGKIPMFYTPHGYSFLMENYKPMKRRMFKMIESVCAKRNCTTISCSVGEHQESLKLTRRATYVNNGINMAELQEIIDKTEKVEHSFTVYTLGRICYQKNPTLFNEIAESLPDVKFVWIGDGELRDQLTSENIEITGWADRSTAIRYAVNKDKFENVLVCSQDFHEEDYKGLVISFEQIEMTRAIGGNDLKAIKEVRALIKKYNPDIVYAHSSKAGAIARVADIGLRNHCVYNPHGWAFNMRCSAKKKAIYTMIEKIAAPFCDKIICISDAEKQSALDKKICKEDKLQIIFNGVDIEAYENGAHGAVKRRDLNIPEDAFVVGMVGRISQQKAPDVFIKMAKQVKDEVPNAHFIIVGNGNQEDEIRKYAKDNGFSDSLHITGWVDDPMSYVELFDVACLLSRWEGFGLALPEYMMAGKPIVASRVDAIPNIIRDGENGLLVKVDDDVGASNAVMRIYQEDELKDKLVTQGLEDVHNRFNARRVSEEHGRLFEESLRNSQK